MDRAGKRTEKTVNVKDSAEVKKKKEKPKKPQNLNYCKFHLMMIYTDIHKRVSWLQQR